MADDEDIPTDAEFSFKLSYDEDEELIESLTQAKCITQKTSNSHLKNFGNRVRLGHSVYSQMFAHDFPNQRRFS